MPPPSKPPRPTWSLTELIAEIGTIGIVDVGAMFFGFDHLPYAGLLRAGKARVIGFEPNRQECDKLNAAFGPPHQFHPFFIGDGADATYYETNKTMTGSLYRPNRPLLETFQLLHEQTTLQAERPVPTRRLDDVPAPGEVDFLKIDVQGAELQVLQGAPRVLADALVVQAEVEFVQLYEGQPLFADVDRPLRAAGFQFHTLNGVGTRCFKPMVLDRNPARGLRQYLWSDAVYVRDFLRLDAIAEPRLLKLAAILHDVYGSYDFCLFVLGEVDRRRGSTLVASYLERLRATRS